MSQSDSAVCPHCKTKLQIHERMRRIYLWCWKCKAER